MSGTSTAENSEEPRAAALGLGETLGHSLVERIGNNPLLRPDALTRVTMIGNDLKLDDGIGTCGKNGQGVPVVYGGTALKADGTMTGKRLAALVGLAEAG